MLRGHEAVALRAQGAISVSERSGWRLGQLSLGTSALTFQQPGRSGAVRIELAGITRMDVERRTFVMCAKRVVRLTYRSGRAAHPRSCWMITARLGDWEAALARRLGRAREDPSAAEASRPMPAGFATALAGLPGTAGIILDYLVQRGYATTAELTALIGAETQDALLAHLHEDFRQAEQVLGGPLVRYEGAYFDRRSAVLRQQSWRVAETVARGWLSSRIPTDVLAEGDELLVVTSLPTQERGTVPSAVIDPDGRGLVVRGTDGHDRWIALPEEATGEAHCAVSATSTLVIRARRRARGAARPGTDVTGGTRGPRGCGAERQPFSQSAVQE
jgi:hypothetical protein